MGYLLYKYPQIFALLIVLYLSSTVICPIWRMAEEETRSQQHLMEEAPDIAVKSVERHSHPHMEQHITDYKAPDHLSMTSQQ